MDNYELLELLSRDLGDAEEALEVCDPEEAISMKTCLAQMQYILAVATKRVREWQRGQERN